MQTIKPTMYGLLDGPALPPSLPDSPISDYLSDGRLYWDKIGSWRYRLIWRACLSPIDYQVLGSYTRSITFRGFHWEAAINTSGWINKIADIKMFDDTEELACKRWIEDHAAREVNRQVVQSSGSEVEQS
jgi:hypothetical protein